MTDPRLLKLFLCVLCITAALCAYNSAQAQALETEDVTPAIDKGIEYLISQAAEDGSIAHHRRHQHAMTSLSIMALTAIGHQPTDPTPQGQALRHALDFMLDEKRLTEEGYFGRLDNSRMYGHGICALMLCEMLGMGVDEQQDQLIRDRAERAIDLILKAQAVRKREQRFHGGWRYEPNASDADLSVTVWQLMALRAGKSAGIDVPAKAIDDAVAYLERSYKESGARAVVQVVSVTNPGTARAMRRLPQACSQCRSVAGTSTNRSQARLPSSGKKASIVASSGSSMARIIFRLGWIRPARSMETTRLSSYGTSFQRCSAATAHGSATGRSMTRSIPPRWQSSHSVSATTTCRSINAELHT